MQFKYFKSTRIKRMKPLIKVVISVFVQPDSIGDKGFCRTALRAGTTLHPLLQRASSNCFGLELSCNSNI